MIFKILKKIKNGDEVSIIKKIYWIMKKEKDFNIENKIVTIASLATIYNIVGDEL